MQHYPACVAYFSFCETQTHGTVDTATLGSCLGLVTASHQAITPPVGGLFLGDAQAHPARRSRKAGDATHR